MAGDEATGISTLPDSSHDIIASPLPPELNAKILEFFADGWPSMEAVLFELKDMDLPTEVRVVLFPMLGAYMHTVSCAINDHDFDIMTAHAVGISAVMGNPAVTAFIQDQLSSMVGGVVGGMVE